MISASTLPTAYSKMTAGAWSSAAMSEYPVMVPKELSNGYLVGSAMLTPRSSTKPATRETQIELTIPFGPAIAAFRVSSVICADASYPVNVYCAFSNPSRKTNVSTLNPVRFWNPLFVANENRNDADWCVCELGAANRSTTMMSTPRICHHTEMSLSRATSRTPNVLSSPWTNST